MQSKPGAIIIEGHVQGLSNTRSLGEAGIVVYVVDRVKCIAASSKYCKKFFLCPDFKSEEFIYFLMELATKESLHGWVLIPSNDHAVYNLSKNKYKLEPFYKVITPGLSVISNIYDKNALLKTALNQKVPVPITQCFAKETDPVIPQLGFPVLTKGRNGLTFYKKLKKKAFLSNNEKELRSHLKKIASKCHLSETFTQELIPSDGTNKTVSFTAFCLNGEIKTYWMGEKLREHPVRFGTATFARSIFIQECYDQSLPLLKSLNYTGVCEVEYLKDPRSGEYKLIEINARTWLWVGLAKACGVDYAKIIYDFINDIEITYPKDYKLGVSWINPVSDTIFSFISILKLKLGILEYFHSVSDSRNVNALIYKGDNMPFYSYLAKLVLFLNNR